MKRALLVPLLLACLAAPTASAQSSTSPSPKPAAAEPDASVAAEGINWLPSFNEALEVSKASGKKLIVDIYAPWCPWCRRLQREVYTSDAVRTYVNEHFEIVRLNGEVQDDTNTFMEYTLSSAELAQALGATGYPTTVFLGADGSYVTRLPGFAAADDFIYILRYIATDAYLDKSFDDFLAEVKRPSGGR